MGWQGNPAVRMSTQPDHLTVLMSPTFGTPGYRQASSALAAGSLSATNASSPPKTSITA